VKTRWVLALMAVVFGVAMYAGTVLATPQAGVTTTQLAKGGFGPIKVTTQDPVSGWQAALETMGASDVYAVRNTFDPGGQTGWHTHPGPSLVIVTAGTITAYDGDDPTCTPKVYTAGQGFVDPGGGHVHILRNETNLHAETVAIQLVPKDAPRRIDMPAPGNCPF
jgi:quercetin dioxygenase-like cupin family protein